MRRSWLFLLLIPMLARAQESPDALRARVVARATSDGVPVAPLERKIAEGVAKGVPTELIARVVDGLHHRLREAASRCDGWERRDECALAGADALQVGLPAPALDAVLRHREGGEEERLQALFAVSDLTARGVPAETGIALVGQVRGRGPAAALAMVRDIMSAIDAGGSPSDVAQRALERGPPEREGNFRAKPGQGNAKGHDREPKPDKVESPATERPIAPATAPGQQRGR